MGYFQREDGMLVWQDNQAKVWLQPWGRDGLRVRANLAGMLLAQPQGLLEPAPTVDAAAEIEIGEEEAEIRNGSIRATISRGGRLRFFEAESGRVLLEEPEWAYFLPPNRHFQHRDGGHYHLESRFSAEEGERFYGLGQHQHGLLDQKGCVVELRQRNTEVAIPFLISSRKYGFLWNNPALGRVELTHNGTRWVAECTRQLDYCIFYGRSYRELLARYAALTGYPPLLPEWASGFWQCKLRYETQEELLAVAREYKRRGLPLAVIVSDFFNWSHMGDWRFDPDCWPDPPAMVKELAAMGVRLMVSIWPTVSPLSENYQTMRERGLLVNNELGVDAHSVFVDHGFDGPAHFSYYDATNPEGRRFIWETVKKHYFAQGIRVWWLDNAEPDISTWHAENLRYHLGNGLEVGNIYPLLHQMAFYEGMRAAGETEAVTLCRSGWLGSQRFSSIIWSGDIASTFESLQAQVRAGLNMAMSGIPWWTTDIGGFHNGDIRTAYFRELVVRWFQYGVFCPITRLHGHRQPFKGQVPAGGADNEIWSFGEEVYEILRDLLFLRERLRPYVGRQMRTASETGLPPMRPLFVDFPEDPACTAIEDQFMFGPELVVAPVLHEGERERRVYLPAGCDWVDAADGSVRIGGQWLTVPAPLTRIPVFLRKGSGLEAVFLPGPGKEPAPQA